MKYSYFYALVAVLGVALGGTCYSQELSPAQFELGFSGNNNGTLRGLAGQTFTQTINCTLATSANETPLGAQGWSISMAPDEGSNIVGITVTGTVSAEQDEGGSGLFEPGLAVFDGPDVAAQPLGEFLFQSLELLQRPGVGSRMHGFAGGAHTEEGAHEGVVDRPLQPVFFFKRPASRVGHESRQPASLYLSSFFS